MENKKRKQREKTLTNLEWSCIQEVDCVMTRITILFFKDLVVQGLELTNIWIVSVVVNGSNS